MNKKDKPHEEPNREAEQDIRRHRRFSLGEAVGREGGRELLGGASPVPRQRQAELEIEHVLEEKLEDSEGALRAVLIRRMSARLPSVGLDAAAALTDVLEVLLSNVESLREFVRQVDEQWGRMYDERPRFESEAGTPDPDDPYTMDSVRARLGRLRDHID